MLFYPDQYFYNNAQQPRQSRSRSSRRQFPEAGPDPAAAMFAQSPFFQYAPSPASRPEHHVFLDEDELAALQMYRERRRAQAEREERRREELARRRAAEERQRAELARKQAEARARAQEARIRAQVEANARAAARDYYRRKQAQQIALQQAQQEERQRQQQFILEQLRNQFGLFAIPRQSQSDACDSACDSAGQEADDGDARESAQPAEAQGAEAAASAAEPRDAAASEQPAGAPETRDQSEEPDVDPIRRLIEALAPFPVVFSTESSDEEEEEAQPSADPASRAGDDFTDFSTARGQTNDAGDDEPSDEEEGGPTCETASEEDDSEPAFVEFLDPTARPPFVRADAIESEQDDEDDEYMLSPASRKDRTKERQGKAPKDRSKKARLNEKKRKSDAGLRKQQRQEQAKQDQPDEQPGRAGPSQAETAGLLSALEEDLKRMSEGYERLSALPEPADLKDAISRLEGIRIGYRRTEEIYGKLDRIRVARDQRKAKHEITSASVALADKYEALFTRMDEVKRELASKERAETSSPTKHQVLMEEVQDASD